MSTSFFADAAGEDDRIDTAQRDDHAAEVPANLFDKHIERQLRIRRRPLAAAASKSRMSPLLTAQPQQSAVAGQVRQALRPASCRFAG